MRWANSLKSKILLATAVLVLVTGLFALALKLELLTTPKPPPNESSQTVVFPDGGKLEILGVSVGERVVEISPTKWFFSGHSGSSSGTWGGLNVDSESQGGKIIRLKLSSNSPTAMLMEFRMVESDGREMQLPNYLALNDMVWPDHRIGGKSSSPHSFNLKDDRVESVRAEVAKSGLKLLIQQRDPLSGWINLMGPSMYHEPWPGRYIALLTAWQRNLPTLDFRAILADGQMAGFSLPNPDFRKAPAAMVPVAAFPLVHHGGDFMLTLRQVERFRTPGEHPFAAFDMDLRYNGKPVPGLREGPVYFDEAALRAEDEWGNVVTVRRDSIRKKSHWGAHLPADSKRMAVDLRVTRSGSYPHLAHDGFMVLEGVVTADGLGVEFKPSPDAELFGIHPTSAGKIIPNPSGSGELKSWKELKFEIRGESEMIKKPIIERRIGDIHHLKILIFPDESNESAGFPSSGSGGTGSSIDKFHFNRDVDWTAPPELLGPGAKIRVGIHGALKRDDLRFQVELPGLIQPR
jgi:hypothetical protein